MTEGRYWHKYRKLIFIMVGILLVGVHFFRFHRDIFCLSSYHFINEDFSCRKKHTISKASYVILEKDIQTYIASITTTNKVHNISVYFRDLRGGPIMGINEKDDFAPASLLKLPLVITLFSLDEEDESFLDKEIVYTRDILTEYGSPEQIERSNIKLKEGHRYSLSTLAKSAVVDSDNTAYYLIVDYLNKHVPQGSDKILQTWQELGVLDPRTPEEETVSVREYASLYRILYNSGYLSVSNSDTILNWLTQSTFKKGLRVGVPQSIKIAHKFGERMNSQGIKQLHDCGIIYYPENPYLLCIMTKGKDFDELSEAIETISAMVYEEVNGRKQ